MTLQQIQALKAIVESVVEAVKAAGPSGAPGGVIYAALMAHGCSHSQFESLMAGLVKAGKLEKRGQLYFAPASPPVSAMRHLVTGAIERGEKSAIEGVTLPRFMIGDMVTYTNANGVKIKGRTITGYELRKDGYAKGHAYYVTPSDAPWYIIPERCLSLE